MTGGLRAGQQPAGCCGTSQVRLLDGILRRRGEYAGGFIMANDGEAIHADLARLCGEAGMPVVFVDAEPFETEDAYPRELPTLGATTGRSG